LRNKTFTKLKYFEELKSESLARSEIILNADFYEIQHYYCNAFFQERYELIRKV